MKRKYRSPSTSIDYHSASSRGNYYKIFITALKAGSVIAFVGAMKIFITYAHFSPFVEALLAGANYGFAFVFVYCTRLVLGTKTPAVMAMRVVQIFEKVDPRKRNYHTLVREVVGITRAQFSSITGNVTAAFFMALLYATLFYVLMGRSLATPALSQKLLKANFLIDGGGLFYAAIVALCLVVSSLVSSRIDHALQRKKISRFIRLHAGGLIGNALLGFMLSFITFLGVCTGLPLDIRHVIFSAANVSYACMGTLGEWHYSIIFFSIVGTIGIGLTNIFVSFMLMIIIPMSKSKRGFWGSISLMKILVLYFVRNPRTFISAPRKTRTYKEK